MARPPLIDENPVAGGSIWLPAALRVRLAAREEARRRARLARAAELSLYPNAADWIRSDSRRAPALPSPLADAVPAQEPTSVVRQGLLGRAFLSSVSRSDDREVGPLELDRITRGVSSLYVYAGTRPSDGLWQEQWLLWRRVVRPESGGLYVLELVDEAVTRELVWLEAHTG